VRSSNRALRASQRSLPLGLAPRGRAAHDKLITRSAENVLGGLHRDEVFSLAYEHLTNHPRETLAALCRFLELPLPPRWHDAASAIFRPSSGSAKYVVWAGTARADRQRANVDKLVKGARAVLPDYSLPE